MEDFLFLQEVLHKAGKILQGTNLAKVRKITTLYPCKLPCKLLAKWIEELEESGHISYEIRAQFSIPVITDAISFPGIPSQTKKKEPVYKSVDTLQQRGTMGANVQLGPSKDEASYKPQGQSTN